MEEEVYAWMKKSLRRQMIMHTMTQPLTVLQIAKRTGMEREACTLVLLHLTVYRLMKCLNPGARSNRVYWMTEKGKACRQSLREEHRLSRTGYDFPIVDWELYSWSCFRHRSAVLKAITMPLHAAQIRMRAVSQNAALKMSLNNTIDVLRALQEQGLVLRLRLRKKKRSSYELTHTGSRIQQLLWKAEEY